MCVRECQQLPAGGRRYWTARLCRSAAGREMERHIFLLLSHPGRGRDAVVAVGHRPFHGRLFDRESPPFSPMIVPAENDEANPLAPPAGECPSMSPPCFLACTYGSSSLHLPSSPAVRPAGRICMNGRRFNSEFVVNLRAAPIPWWSREVAS